jgi:hypothetical protein
MRPVIRTVHDQLKFLADVFAIGRAVQDGQLTASQASKALDRAIQRSEIRQFENRSLRAGTSAAWRDYDLVAR